MDVYQAITRRRTIKQYTGEPIPRDVVERILDAAVWAPNHHLTEPWRFTVLTGDAKDHLAELRRQQVAEGMPETESAQARLRLDETYRKMSGAAALVVVTCRDHPDPVIQDENRFATAAATQNLLLAATAEGLATFWSSGIARYEQARQDLQIPDDEFIVSIVHLGYPRVELPGRRKSARELTRWLDAVPGPVA